VSQQRKRHRLRKVVNTRSGWGVLFLVFFFLFRFDSDCVALVLTDDASGEIVPFVEQKVYH
jgi:hypothetical protein